MKTKVLFLLMWIVYTSAWVMYQRSYQSYWRGEQSKFRFDCSSVNTSLPNNLSDVTLSQSSCRVLPASDFHITGASNSVLANAVLRFWLPNGLIGSKNVVIYAVNTSADHNGIYQVKFWRGHIVEILQPNGYTLNTIDNPDENLQKNWWLFHFLRQIPILLLAVSLFKNRRKAAKHS